MANGSYAGVNGIELYHEVHGEWEPPVLPHGPAARSYRTAVSVRAGCPVRTCLLSLRRDAGIDGSLRPAARPAILPGTTHYDIASSSALVPAFVPFLGAPIPD